MKLRLIFGVALIFVMFSSFKKSVILSPPKDGGKAMVNVDHKVFKNRVIARNEAISTYAYPLCLSVDCFVPRNDAGNNMMFSVPTYKMAKLKYNGGGDWYGDRTALPNLIKFCNDNLKTNFQPEDEVVEVGSAEIFNYPFIFMTGHGNVIFSDAEARNLRKYLTGGGFLHIDDNYGLDQFVRPQMKKVFPELDFVELPVNHPIYHQKYDFPAGLPKIHEHDGKHAQGFGLIYKGRLVCFYTYECDLGNGWEDFGTYAGDTQETRLKALKMGANLIQYILTQ